MITCSALRRRYRDLLTDGHPSVRFVHLEVDAGVLAERVSSRHHEYMPATLLDSQLAALEPPGPDEPAVTVDATGPVAESVAVALDGSGALDDSGARRAVRPADPPGESGGPSG